MIEAPMELQQSLTIPADHYAACAAASPSVPTAGNAAGNTVDLLDLSGQPSPPAPLPPGFTARGIVALVFSCVSGFLGVAVVAWYGLVGGEEEAAKNASGAAGAKGNEGIGGVFSSGGATTTTTSGEQQQQETLQHREGITEVQEVTMVSGGGGSARA